MCSVHPFEIPSFTGIASSCLLVHGCWPPRPQLGTKQLRFHPETRRAQCSMGFASLLPVPLSSCSPGSSSSAHGWGTQPAPSHRRGPWLSVRSGACTSELQPQSHSSCLLLLRGGELPLLFQIYLKLLNNVPTTVCSGKMEKMSTPVALTRYPLCRFVQLLWAWIRRCGGHDPGGTASPLLEDRKCKNTQPHPPVVSKGQSYWD